MLATDHPLSKPATEFQDVVDLVRDVEASATKADRGQWQIGDLLIRKCGAPGDRGINTGRNAKFKRIAEELERAGFTNYSVAHLKDLCKTAAHFPELERSDSLPWSIHKIAKDPETLKDVVENEEPVTAKVVRNFIRQRNKAEKKKHKKRRKPAPDPKRATASARFLENALKALELGNDAARVMQRYVLTAEELADRDAVIAVWSKIGASQLDIDEIPGEAAE